MSECFLSVVLIEMRQDRFLARGLFLSRNVSFLSFLRGSVVGAMFLKCVFEREYVQDELVVLVVRI